jgi:hypothetical protein
MLKPQVKDVYMLDATGYLVLRGVVPKEQINVALHEVNHRLGIMRYKKFTFFDMGGVFWDIMTNPAILGIVNEVCGEWFRLDHAFGICQSFCSRAVTPHGGTSSSRGCHHWGDVGGKPICHGQLSVSVALNHQGGELGGVAMLPGSHKSVIPMEGGSLVGNNPMTELPYVSPELWPGDVLVMPENLVHGNRLWQKELPRFALYYMYFPAYSGYRIWDKRQEEHAKLARNELERRIFRPPGVATIDDTNIELGRNCKPESTVPVRLRADLGERAAAAGHRWEQS